MGDCLEVEGKPDQKYFSEREKLCPNLIDKDKMGGGVIQGEGKHRIHEDFNPRREGGWDSIINEL